MNPLQDYVRHRRMAFAILAISLAFMVGTLFLETPTGRLSAPIVSGPEGNVVAWTEETPDEGDLLTVIRERRPDGTWSDPLRRRGGTTALAVAEGIRVRFSGAEVSWEAGDRVLETRNLGPYLFVAAGTLPAPAVGNPPAEGRTETSRIWAIGVRQDVEFQAFDVGVTEHVLLPCGPSLIRPHEAECIRVIRDGEALFVTWRERIGERRENEVHVARFAAREWSELPGFTATETVDEALDTGAEGIWWTGLVSGGKESNVTGRCFRDGAWTEPRLWPLTGKDGFEQLSGLALTGAKTGVARLYLAGMTGVREFSLAIGAAGAPTAVGTLAAGGEISPSAGPWGMGVGGLMTSVLLVFMAGVLMRDRLRFRRMLETSHEEKIRQTRRDALRRRSVREAVRAMAEDAPAIEMPKMTGRGGLGAVSLPSLLYAAPWQRGVAYGLDFFLSLPVAYFLAQQCGLDIRGGPPFDPDRILLFEATYQAFFFAYYFGCELLWGQTFGKYALGIRVVSTSGGVPGLTGILLRNLIGVLERYPLFIMLAFGSMVFSRQTQRFGDRIAGTVVIRRSPAPVSEPDDE